MSKTALMFAGQGAQYVGMGKDLAEQVDGARTWFDRANEVLGYDLTRICFEGPEEVLTQTEHAQPGIYLVGYAAFQLLRQAVPGLEFHATAGLSLGEFTALAAADALSFEDGLKLVRRRGQLMQEACEQTKGGMAAIIGLAEPTVRAICEATGVEVANLNCPGQIVISGPLDNLNAACEQAKAQGARRAIPLSVAGAYHSSLMAEAGRRLAEDLEKVELRTPRVPVISNVTAAPHGSPDEIRPRLVDQVTSSVRWEASMRALLADGFTRFIELGPGTALSGFIKRIDRTVQVLNVSDAASLQAAAQALQN